MAKSKYLSTSPDETKNIARELIQKHLKRETDKALVFALEGELGAGKTNFTQGVARALGIKRNITSPTFVLVKKYNVQKNMPDDAESKLYHLDCYRVQSSQDILDLEWQDIIKNKNNIVIVEWAERIKDIIPKDAVWVTMKNIGEEEREIIVS